MGNVGFETLLKAMGYGVIKDDDDGVREKEKIYFKEVKKDEKMKNNETMKNDLTEEDIKTEKAYIFDLLKDMVFRDISMYDILQTALKDQRLACVKAYEKKWLDDNYPVYSGNESQLFDYEEVIKDAIPKRII